MGDDFGLHDGRGRLPWRVIGWGGAAGILLLPWLTDAPWTLFDFLLAGILLGGAGLLAELTVRTGNIAYRAGAGVAVAAAFLLFLVNGAVGFLGNENNPANLVFAGVIGFAILGSVLTGFRPAGMARAMLATAGSDGFYEVAIGTTIFATLWLVSAGLFGVAGRQASAVSAQ